MTNFLGYTTNPDNGRLAYRVDVGSTDVADWAEWTWNDTSYVTRTGPTEVLVDITRVSLVRRSLVGSQLPDLNTYYLGYSRSDDVRNTRRMSALFLAAIADLDDGDDGDDYPDFSMVENYDREDFHSDV